MNNTCAGAGLISLDILIKDEEGKRPVSYYVGGTCGNVLMILSHMGWNSYPIARLDNSKHTIRLLEDMSKHGVHCDYISTDNGKTPVIIQHNIIDKDGMPTHKFEFQGTNGRLYLDFRSLTQKQAKEVMASMDFVPKLFFFDRISPAIIDMAKAFKAKGSLIYFEPSCKVTTPKFDQCLNICDIVKFSVQRISDVSIFEDLKDILIIQTLGADGLRFRMNSNWINLAAVPNKNVIDTSGAGDWTTASFIYYLFADDMEQHLLSLPLSKISEYLAKAQKIGSMSCSYDGARGMMNLPFKEIITTID